MELGAAAAAWCCGCRWGWLVGGESGAAVAASTFTRLLGLHPKIRDPVAGGQAFSRMISWNGTEEACTLLQAPKQALLPVACLDAAVSSGTHPVLLPGCRAGSALLWAGAYLSMRSERSAELWGHGQLLIESVDLGSSSPRVEISSCEEGRLCTRENEAREECCLAVDCARPPSLSPDESPPNEGDLSLETTPGSPTCRSHAKTVVMWSRLRALHLVCQSIR